MMNNPLDFNNAENQRGDLIPAGTLCKVVMTIRPGGEVSSEGWLTQSQSSDAMYLNCEFTISEGPHARRKIWTNMTLSGGKKNDKGESIAAGISRATLRAILESAKNIVPTDMSEASMAKRRVQSFEEFNGLEFAAKIGIEKGKDGYADKNNLAAAITPDKKEYAAVMGGTYTGNPAPAPAKQATPAWAAGNAAPTNTTPPAQAPAPAPEPAKNSTVPAWAK